MAALAFLCAVRAPFSSDRAFLCTYAYFTGNALIGPTLGNYTDLCQLPLVVFALMQGILERRWRLITVAALVMPLIREDTGVVLVAIGLWLLSRDPPRWRLAHHWPITHL